MLTCFQLCHDSSRPDSSLSHEARSWSCTDVLSIPVVVHTSQTQKQTLGLGLHFIFIGCLETSSLHSCSETLTLTHICHICFSASFHLPLTTSHLGPPSFSFSLDTFYLSLWLNDPKVGQSLQSCYLTEEMGNRCVCHQTRCAHARWQTNRRNALMWCRWKLGPDITAASCLRFSTQHHIWSRSRLVGRHAQGQRTVHGRSANQTALQYTSL